MVAGRQIRCLLFDLGSTLWTRREEAVAQAKEEAYTAAGTILRRSRGENLFSPAQACATGHLLHKALAKRIHREKERKPEYEPNFRLATQEALRQMGISDIDEALAAELFEALRVRIPASRVLFADALSTLAGLKQRGYILGVVTNRDHGGPLFHKDLQTMGLLDYFEYQHMAISADLGIRKPHPEIFKYALHGLNVLPEEAAMVGDNLNADIAGAQQLNIFAIWKPRPPLRAEGEKKSDPERERIKPDVTIRHLNELLEMF